jgi:hypothetical protein
MPSYMAQPDRRPSARRPSRLPHSAAQPTLQFRIVSCDLEGQSNLYYAMPKRGGEFPAWCSAHIAPRPGVPGGVGGGWSLGHAAIGTALVDGQRK